VLRQSRAVRNVLMFVAILGAVACSRNVRIESEPNRGYAVLVHNTMPHAMIVSYNDGSGPRILGTVLGGASDRFMIVSPKKADVVVTATDEARSHNREYSVTLVAGQDMDVAIR
jgi:hypothetical protein